jgi:signal transduction histidine kinase
MILLVTASKRGLDCAGLLQQALAEPVQVAANPRRATALLRKQEYRAIVVEDAVWEADPEGLNIMLNAAGDSVPVYVNLAISNTERVVHQVRHTLRHQAEFRLKAMRAAEAQLANELRDPLTGILLSTELVLQSPGLSPDAQEKLQTVRLLATHIRARLESFGSIPESQPAPLNTAG